MFHVPYGLASSAEPHHEGDILPCPMRQDSAEAVQRGVDPIVRGTHQAARRRTLEGLGIGRATLPPALGTVCAEPLHSQPLQLV